MNIAQQTWAIIFYDLQTSVVHTYILSVGLTAADTQVHDQM